MYNLNADKEKFFYLGKVIKTHGYRGELIFLIETDKPDLYNKLEVVFIDIEHSLVPWFIEDIDIQDDRAVVRLEDVSELEYARTFLKKELYLPIEKLENLEGKDFYFHEIVGYDVTDEQHGDIGKLEDILKRTEQDLLRIMKGDKEILVPLTDEIILNIDRKNKILHLDTPSGLIDLYLD